MIFLKWRRGNAGLSKGLEALGPQVNNKQDAMIGHRSRDTRLFEAGRVGPSAG